MDMKYALMALLLFGFCFAGLSIDKYTLSPEVVEPGGSGVLQITITNTGVQTDTVRSVAIAVSSVEALGIDRTFAVGDLESGASTVISLPFAASENISNGFYTVEVRATGTGESYYLDSNNQLASKTETFEKSASIPVQIVKQPVLSISLSKDSIEDISEVNFSLKNDGGSARRVEVTLLNPDVGFLNSGKLYVDSVDASASATVPATIDARAAKEGATKLQFQLSYQNELGTTISEVVEVPVTIKKSEGNFVFVQNAPIVSGQNDRLSLNLTNEGNDISNLRFSFGTNDTYLIGMNEYKVGDLAGGEAKTFSVPVKANVEPGTHNIAVELSWEENGENQVATVTLPVEIVSDSSVGIYLEAKTNPLTAGADNTLSVTVSNLGNYNIQGTTVRVDSEAFTLDTIQPEQFIGELDSDDFSSVQYDITVNQVRAGEYPANVTVSFRDASGKWMTVKRQIPITISGRAMTSDTQRNSGLNYLVIAGTVVVGGAAYLLWKRWKGGKKQVVEVRK